MSEALRFVIRTPTEVAFDALIRAGRVPTETGLAGVRPRAEPMLLVIEAGLIVLRLDVGTRYAATAGGLYESSRESGVLHTPFAAVGGNAREILATLERELRTSDGEIALRRQLGDLEQRIIRELRTKPRTRPGVTDA
jgi:F0F1-type ATP synthase epsilon subunit